MATPSKDISSPNSNLPEKLIEKLISFESVDAPVISLYLDARPDQNGRKNFLPFVRKQINERIKTYAADSAERESLEEDFVRITRYLESEVNSTSRGLAIFACSMLNDYFEVGQFNAPFKQNRLFINERPHIYPLARLNDQYRRYAVLLADTNRARIFVFASGRTSRREVTENVKTKHTQIGGWSQSRYQRHEENYHIHHAKEVVEMLDQVMRDERIEHVILAGDEKTVIPLLRNEMPEAMAEKVVDVLSLGVDTPEHELLAESLRAFRSHDSLEDMQKVERLLNEYRADDLAVAGVPDVIAALSNGQVEELLIAASPSGLLYDENEVKKVMEIYDGPNELPATLDQRIVAEDLIRRASQRSAAKVTFIEDAHRLEQVGGVGALLRYRISEQSAAPYEQGNQVSRSEALIESKIDQEGESDV